MRKIAISLFVLVTACATPTTGVIQRGEGLMTVTRQGSSALVLTESLKADATTEANEYCNRQRMAAKVIHTKEIQAGAFGRWPEAEILFRCIKNE